MKKSRALLCRYIQSLRTATLTVQCVWVQWLTQHGKRCPQRWKNLHSWTFPQLSYTRPWATWCNFDQLFSGQEAVLKDLWRSLPTWNTQTRRPGEAAEILDTAGRIEKNFLLGGLEKKTERRKEKTPSTYKPMVFLQTSIAMVFMSLTLTEKKKPVFFSYHVLPLREKILQNVASVPNLSNHLSFMDLNPCATLP